MQQRLKAPAGLAGAGIVATEFLVQVLVAMHDAVAALDPGFRWEALAALARHLESRTRGLADGSS